MKKLIMIVCLLFMVISGCVTRPFEGLDFSNLSEGLNKVEQHEEEGVKVMETTTMLASAEGFLGTIWFTALVFVAGAFIGAPMWNWVKEKFPWNQ